MLLKGHRVEGLKIEVAWRGMTQRTFRLAEGTIRCLVDKLMVMKGRYKQKEIEENQQRARNRSFIQPFNRHAVTLKEISSVISA